MIFYFSATGNCKYVAECIARETNDVTISITECMEQERFEFEVADDERIGIVSPTYAWKLPLIVEEFLDRLHIAASGSPYIYFVATYGTTPGQTGYYAKKRLAKRGLALSAAYGVKMPDNWTPTFDLSDPQKVGKINAAAEERIQTVISQIRSEARGNFQFPRTPHFTDRIAAHQYEEMRQTRHFVVEDSCIGCGLCAAKCPSKAIRMEEKKPVWIKEQCYMCLGCLHRCPKFSIQYGNRTKAHGQYLHPKTKV